MEYLASQEAKTLKVKGVQFTLRELTGADALEISQAATVTDEEGTRFDINLRNKEYVQRAVIDSEIQTFALAAGKETGDRKDWKESSLEEKWHTLLNRVKYEIFTGLITAIVKMNEVTGEEEKN